MSPSVGADHPVLAIVTKRGRGNPQLSDLLDAGWGREVGELEA